MLNLLLGCCSCVFGFSLRRAFCLRFSAFGRRSLFAGTLFANWKSAEGRPPALSFSGFLALSILWEFHCFIGLLRILVFRLLLARHLEPEV